MFPKAPSGKANDEASRKELTLPARLDASFNSTAATDFVRIDGKVAADALF